MNLEFVGLVIGIVGALWMKVSMHLLNQERQRPEVQGLPAKGESPALKAFTRALSLILLGLGIETFARIFLQ